MPACPGFRTVLFPPGTEEERAGHDGPPPCAADLNLDLIVDAAVAEGDEKVLRPFFWSPYRNGTIIRYRQEIFADLERADVLEPFPPFREAMRTVRANLDYAGRISCAIHRQMVHLRAVHLYCRAVSSLLQRLERLTLGAAGLRALRRYLADTVRSESFARLASEASGLRASLGALNYGTLLHGDRISVRRYASEPDYSATVLERFARFRQAEIASPPAEAGEDGFALNHIEAGILAFVARLYPREFHALEAFVARHGTFIDEVLATFDREIGFFLAYLAFIEPIRRAGLPFCYPMVSATTRETHVSGSFDLALAAKRTAERQPVVCNDFFLRGAERLIVVSGPNQGGKTTFARMFGQLHFLAALGCPVPGKDARLFLPDRIFTHFERAEDVTNLRSKLEDELVRLHRTCQAMTSESLVILNEIFNSTSLGDQVFLGTRIIGKVLAADATGVCVTFIDALSRLGEKTVSMVSTVSPDDPAHRTFEIIRRPADGLAHALSLAEKWGVTYEHLRARVRP